MKETEGPAVMTLYPNAGAAVAFSPRLDALLAEIALRVRYLARQLTLVHVGALTPDKERRLQDALRRAGLDEGTRVCWVEGSPDEAIVQTVHKEQIDLLLAGALEREKALRYYLGSVARNLVREAPCSLMLFTSPQEVPKPMRRIVVVTDYSEGALIALVRAVRFAEREGAERIFVVRVLSQYGEAMVMAEGLRREQAAVYQKKSHEEERGLLQDFVDAAGHVSVQIEPHFVQGHPGQAVAQFVHKQQVELLVMPSSGGFGHILERIFPSGMEWLLREIPCNLWVVRERPPVG